MKRAMMMAAVMATFLSAVPVLGADFVSYFDDNLAGWTVDYGIVEPFPDLSNPGTNNAVFKEADPDPDTGEIIPSVLSQTFFMPANALSLSFNAVFDIVGGETDKFYVQLIDVNAVNPDGSVGKPLGDNLIFGEYLYELTSNDDPNTPANGVTVSGSLVNIDIPAGWANREVQLVFALKPDLTDDVRTVTLSGLNLALAEMTMGIKYTGDTNISTGYSSSTADAHLEAALIDQNGTALSDSGVLIDFTVAGDKLPSPMYFEVSTVNGVGGCQVPLGKGTYTITATLNNGASVSAELVVTEPAVNVKYAGDTEVSTNGEQTATANLVGELYDANHQRLSLAGEPVAFTLTGNGEVLSYAGDTDANGAGTATAHLKPGTYDVVVTLVKHPEARSTATLKVTAPPEPPVDVTPAKVTYIGDTLVSTGSAATATVNLKALVQNAAAKGLDGKLVTFNLTAPGMSAIYVGPITTSSDPAALGVAATTRVLGPAVYNILVTVADSDITDTAILVVYSPTADGFITGGGWTTPANDGINTHPNARCNFGFNAKAKNGVATGNLEFRFSDGYIDLKSTSIEQVMFISQQVAQFTGYASVNKTAGYWFLVTVVDAGEPGTSDQWSIQIWAPDPQGFYFDDPVDSASGKLQGGNIQIHLKK